MAAQHRFANYEAQLAQVRPFHVAQETTLRLVLDVLWHQLLWPELQTVATCMSPHERSHTSLSLTVRADRPLFK